MYRIWVNSSHATKGRIINQIHEPCAIYGPPKEFLDNAERTAQAFIGGAKLADGFGLYRFGRASRTTRAAGAAGVPLGVGDFVARHAADDSLFMVDHTTVLGAIAQGESDVLGPFIGLVVPLRAIRRRGGRFRAGDQAVVNRNAGLWLAVIAASEHESLPMAEINDGNEVWLAVRRKLLPGSDLQSAAAADFDDVR